MKNFEKNIGQGESLLELAAKKLNLDPKNTSLNEVEAVMLGLPKESSVYEVEKAKEDPNKKDILRFSFLAEK
ncbi:MAG: hypothetical protein U5L76_01390 [Patescibacteria group bacterium]|nr:hypothetical protein [Patescibacteria group bacterium]